jgi:hypothetical protein
VKITNFHGHNLKALKELIFSINIGTSSKQLLQLVRVSYPKEFGRSEGLRTMMACLTCTESPLLHSNLSTQIYTQ